MLEKRQENGPVGRRIVDDSTYEDKAESKRVTEKGKLRAQNFQKEEELFIQKGPRHPHGGIVIKCHVLYTVQV